MRLTAAAIGNGRLLADAAKLDVMPPQMRCAAHARVAHQDEELDRMEGHEPSRHAAAAQAENERMRDSAAHRPGHQTRLRVILRGGIDMRIKEGRNSGCCQEAGPEIDVADAPAPAARCGSAWRRPPADPLWGRHLADRGMREGSILGELGRVYTARQE